MASTTYTYRKQVARIVASMTEYNHQYGSSLDSMDIIDIVNTFNDLMTQDGVKNTIANLEAEYPEDDRDTDIKEILDDMRGLLDYDATFHVYEFYHITHHNGFPGVVHIWAPIRTASDKLTGYRIVWGTKEFDAELIRSPQNCEYLKFSEVIDGTGYTYVISSRDLWI